MSLALLRRDLKHASNPIRAEHSKRFFKTGKGQYGEGDVFVGATVPALRKIARAYPDLSLPEIKHLLDSKIHEERLIGFILLTYQYTAQKKRQLEIYRFYLTQAKRANNWDLVDVSAYHIVGAHLLKRPRAILDRLARSKNLWEKRIAIVSTLAFIRTGALNDTFRIVQRLMDDPHDLIQKACGWMLREAGKKDGAALRIFLDEHGRRMPRTMLRYAIERFPPAERLRYLRA